LGKLLTEPNVDAHPRGMLSSGLFNPDDDSVLIKSQQTRADVGGRHLLNFTVIAESQLAGAAADIDIQDDPAGFGGMSGRAGTMCRHRGFEAVTGAYRDELSRLLRKQFRDRARIASPDCYAR